jgi:MYXO-CTERM domain-containing protein
MFRLCVPVGLVASVLLFTAPARAIVTGTQDTFQDSTVMDWSGGTTISNSPGGPAGDSDLFLLVASNGGAAGPGSKLAAHNADSRWAGDYIAAGVTAIEADMINVGDTSLQMRLVLFSAGERWTSSNFITLAPGGDWQHVSFPISASDLTRVLGSGSFAADLAAVDQIMFRHDGSTPSAGGESISGSIGIDNITAVPSPAGIALLGLAGIAAARRRR